MYISIFEIWTSKVGKDSRMYGWVGGWMESYLER